MKPHRNNRIQRNARMILPCLEKMQLSSTISPFLVEQMSLPAAKTSSTSCLCQKPGHRCIICTYQWPMEITPLLFYTMLFRKLGLGVSREESIQVTINYSRSTHRGASPSGHSLCPIKDKHSMQLKYIHIRTIQH